MVRRAAHKAALMRRSLLLFPSPFPRSPSSGGSSTLRTKHSRPSPPLRPKLRKAWPTPVSCLRVTGVLYSLKKGLDGLKSLSLTCVTLNTDLLLRATILQIPGVMSCLRQEISTSSGGYRDRGEKQKYYCGEIPEGFILSPGDLLVAMTEQAAGLLGSPIIVPESGIFLHNQRLGLVTKKPGVKWLNEFFFHVFNTKPVRTEIHDSASGVKVRHTSPTKIGEVVVAFPAVYSRAASASLQSSTNWPTKPRASKPSTGKS